MLFRKQLSERCVANGLNGGSFIGVGEECVGHIRHRRSESFGNNDRLLARSARPLVQRRRTRPATARRSATTPSSCRSSRNARWNSERHRLAPTRHRRSCAASCHEHRLPTRPISQPEAHTCERLEVNIERVNSSPSRYAFAHDRALLTRFRRPT